MALKSQYKIVTENEWEINCEKRISKWKDFNEKNKF